LCRGGRRFGGTVACEASAMGGDGCGPSAPPVSTEGLGNYKGVMLCNRPTDGAPQTDVQPPFRSAIAATAGEQLGLPPPKRMEPKPDIKKCGPSAALRRHVQWIKELQEQVREDQRRTAECQESEEARKHHLAAAFKQQRDAIRKIKADAKSGEVDPAVVEAVLQPKARNSASGGRTTAKPLWAMTEDERDDFDEEQASELLRFAEGLDFDSYIHDLEFRQCLHVVRDRARHLQRAQDDFKESIVRQFDQAAGMDDAIDGDATSSAGGHGLQCQRHAAGRGGGPEEKPDWDTSTACGDERPTVDKSSQNAAHQLLESNPKLRSVHSKGSVQKVMEKARASAADA